MTDSRRLVNTVVFIISTVFLNGCVNTYVGVGGVTIPVPVYQPEIKKKETKKKGPEENQQDKQETEENSSNG